MNAVYIVFKSYTTLDAVDDELNVTGVEVSEVVAVFSSGKAAAELCKELQEQNDDNVAKFDCDPVVYAIGRYDVE